MIIIFVISTNYNVYTTVACFCTLTPIDLPGFPFKCGTVVRILAAYGAQSTTNDGTTSSVVMCSTQLYVFWWQLD